MNLQITSSRSSGRGGRKNFPSLDGPSEKARQMKGLIDAMLLHIKAFDGDVFGGVVRDYRVGGTTYVKDINCRIDNLVLQVFLQSLHVYFTVEDIGVEVGGQFADYCKRIKVYRKDEERDSLLYTSNRVSGSSGACYVYIDIVVMSRAEWMRLPCDFDINLLAENTHSLFLRIPYITLNQFTDKLNHVMDRIKQNTFCTLESSYAKTPDQVKTLIDRACRFVSRGWVMDDSLVGDKIWVVGTWQYLSNGLRMVRKGYNRSEYDKMISMKDCSICNEEFKKSDIVINTKCNHNFHWQEGMPRGGDVGCNSTCKGLKEWVNRGNITCPICRQLMF